MRGWHLFWGALIGTGIVSNWLGEDLGETAQAWFAGIAFLAIIIGVFIARAAHKTRVQQRADVLITRHDNYEPGAFLYWHENTTEPDADRMRIADASREIVRAYGGRDVINLLIREGFQDVILEDLKDVFGDRAQSIYPAAIQAANQVGFLGSVLLPFGLGLSLATRPLPVGEPGCVLLANRVADVGSR